MKRDEFLKLHTRLIELGYESEIQWQENVKICNDPYDFFSEYVWVVLNSGMKEQIARKIHDKIKKAWKDGVDISKVFKHKGKVKAIKGMLLNYTIIFRQYQGAIDKISYLEELPYIGKITKYHLAKNLGLNCVKPDRHLIRIANKYNTTPDKLCSKLSKETRYKKATIDIVLWRAANLGLL